jgi:hypothetical protein
MLVSCLTVLYCQHILLQDVRLVWSNCKTFNLEYSLLSHHASL